MSSPTLGIDADQMLRTQLTLSAVEGSATEPDRTATDRLAAAIAAHLSPRAAGPIEDWASEDAIASRAQYVALAINQALECPMCLSELVGLPVMDILERLAAPRLSETELRGQWGDR